MRGQTPSHRSQRVPYYERVRRHQNDQAGGLRLVQWNGLAGLAIAIFIHEGGVLVSLFFGAESTFVVGARTREFEPAATLPS
jgi:hypothetical protein